MKRVRAGAFFAVGLGIAAAAIPANAFGQSVPVYAESASDALARNVRILAESPRDFTALVSAGKAALDLGDPQSAAGFFGRAEEVNPASSLAKAGMGAALVMSGDPTAALTYFAQAQQSGASAASIGVDRGLAYDLLGNHVAAQTDYRAALAGADRDEARRRLALSLAIVGKKDEALAILAPLNARGDSGAARCRALVLALSGDTEAAKQTLNARMPGSAAAMGPFFRMLPTLSSPQKAAAVNLGIFPDRGAAYASAPSSAPSPSTEDRLASIEQLLGQQPQQEQQQAAATPNWSLPQQAKPYSYSTTQTAAPQQRPAVQLASVPRSQIRAASPNNDLIETKRIAADPGAKKIWLQLASVDDATELPDRFQKIRARKPSLFEGISGYVASEQSRSRLLIGPFHSEEDARLFADALTSVRIDSRRWVSEPREVVRKLPTR